DSEVSGSAVGGRRTSFAVRGAPLGSAVGGGGLILLLAEDQTESRRVEEVRRGFVANISHELKTPVGALALLAETMGEGAGEPEAGGRVPRPDAAGGIPAHLPGPGPDHPVEDPGRRARPGPESGRARRSGGRGPGQVPDESQRTRDRAGGKLRPGACGAWRRGPADHGVAQS